MTALLCLCLCAPGDFFSPLPVQIVSYNQRTNTDSPGYFPVDPLFGHLVGQGQSILAYNTFDTFAEYDLSRLSGPVTSFTLAGSIDSLQDVPAGSGPPNDYFEEGIYAYLNVDVRAISPTTTDGAGLFAAFAAGTAAASFTIDDNVAPTHIAPPGAPFGPTFTLLLSPAAVALAEADRLAGRPFWLGFAGLGQAGGGPNPPFMTSNVHGVLFLVPEPASLGLLLLGLPLLRRRR
jgi:hypothetical protein